MYFHERPKTEKRLISSKVYLGEKSRIVFQKILKESPGKKDKTQEVIAQLEGKYKSLCKNINQLLLLANPDDTEAEKDKLKERVDNFFDKELPDIIELYVSM
jgi:hypothetical protein